jgi:hypothetical protein
MFTTCGTEATFFYKIKISYSNPTEFKFIIFIVFFGVCMKLELPLVRPCLIKYIRPVNTL